MLPVALLLLAILLLYFYVNRRSVRRLKQKGRTGNDSVTFETAPKTVSLSGNNKGKPDTEDTMLELVSGCLVHNNFYQLEQLSGRLRNKRWAPVSQLEELETIGTGQFGRIQLLSLLSLIHI